MTVAVHHGNCLEILPTLPADSIDACVTDPPYHLTTGKKGGTGLASLNPNSPAGRARISTGFMGKAWDGGDVAFRPETWAEVLRVLKPGAHFVAFGAPRNYHRMACAIEDAGFEIRDSLMWLFGSGFPKSHDVSKGIDKAAGAQREIIGDSPFAARKPNGSAGVNSVGLSDTAGSKVTAPATAAARQWQGWGTALKPAYEPIILARKPIRGTVAGNVLAHGTGAINVDACRVGTDGGTTKGSKPQGDGNGIYGAGLHGACEIHELNAGRWPANVLLSYPDDEYALRPDVSREQKADLYRWMSENA